MRQNKFIRLAVSLLSLLLLCNVITVSAASASLSAASVETVAGQTAVIPISLQNCELLSGINFTVSYDTAKLSYIENSSVSSILTESPIIYNDTSKGVINFAWDSSDGNKNINGSFITLQFKVAENTSSGSIKLTVTVKEAYRVDVVGGVMKSENIDITAVNGNITVKAGDTSVSDTISAIANIGTVTYDAAALERINSATNKYLALSYTQRQQVTNFTDLIAAREKYEQLEKEYNAQAAKNEADKWRSDNAAILAKTVNNLTLADKPAVQAALNSYTKLSTSAMAQAIKEKNALNILNNYFPVLEKIEQDANYEAELRTQAQQAATQFRKDFATLLSTSVNEIYTEQNDYIVYALSEIENQAMMNPYVSEYLTAEKSHLEELRKRIEELLKIENAEESDSIIAANQFKLDYSYVLNLAAADVTADDAIEIKVALAVLKNFDSDTQALLKNEKNHLESLEAAVDGIDDDSKENETVEENKGGLVDMPESEYPETITKTVRVETKQTLNPVIWILLGIFTLATLAVVGLWIFYLHIKKRKEPDEL